MAAREPIPRKLRAKVWRAMFTHTNKEGYSVCYMDGKCFACNTRISYDNNINEDSDEVAEESQNSKNITSVRDGKSLLQDGKRTKSVQDGKSLLQDVKNLTQEEQLPWHCGHIVADANGGKTILTNLKPLCRTCNLRMGTMNMYEYILNNSPGKTSPGKFRLRTLTQEGNSSDHKMIKRALDIAELVEITEKRLRMLQNARILSPSKVNKYSRKMRAKRGSMMDRASVMEEVQALYMQFVRK